jgi:hypothetical protein
VAEEFAQIVDRRAKEKGVRPTSLLACSYETIAAMLKLSLQAQKEFMEERGRN